MRTPTTAGWDEQYLTANALLSAFTPEGLYPLGFAAEPIDSGKNRGTAAFIERHAPGGADLNLGAVRAPVHVQLGA